MVYIFVALFSLFGFAGKAHAEIRMSEIYPAPASGYEWVELCNDSPQPISLTSYTIVDSTGKSIFVPTITLEPQQYVLATSSGVLNNGGDTVHLRKNGLGIESTTYSTSLTALESLISCAGIWSITTDITPGFQNTRCGISPTMSFTDTPTPASFISIHPTPKYPQKSGNEPSITDIPHLEPTTLPTVQLFSLKHAPIRSHISPTVSPTPNMTPIVIPTAQSKNHLWKVFFASLCLISMGCIGYYGYHVARTIKDTYNDVHDP